MPVACLCPVVRRARKVWPTRKKRDRPIADQLGSPPLGGLGPDGTSILPRSSSRTPTTEVCDGLPSDVEANVITFDRYCPWQAEVIDVAE